MFLIFTVADVSLKTTFFLASEDVGMVEVCVIINCPRLECSIAFPFDVRISTADETAGNVMILCTFGTKRVCVFNLTIV